MCVGGRTSRFCSVWLVASALCFAQVAVTTYHNDLDRTGANLSETLLNTSNVSVDTFGKLFSRAVDGQIYAQPLYLSNLQIPGKGVHNVVFVCTEHDSVYAFDADDPAAATPLWHVNFGASVPAPRDQDLVPEIGITGTPVIDTNSSTLYVVAETLESGQTIFRLHALDVTTGAERFNGPVVIQGSVAGTGVGSQNGVLNFDPVMHWQRPGLLLTNGKVYIAFGGHQDTEPYHGWLFAYNATTLARIAIQCVSPDSHASGLWQGGVALAADSNGFIYTQTGQGPFDVASGGSNFGDSVVKFDDRNNDLAIADYFTPSNQADLDPSDADFGSSGPLLIPGTSLGVSGGKDGKIFLWDRNNLGHFNSATDQVVQSWQAVGSSRLNATGGLFGGGVFYKSALYVWGQHDVLKKFSFNGSVFNTVPAVGTITIPTGYSDEPGLSLSANGLTSGTGIIWAAYSSNGGSNGHAYPGILRAFDASQVSVELWNSNENSARDSAGSWAKWVPPTIANGKVYLATFDNVLNVYGLFSPPGLGQLSGSGNSTANAVNLTTEGLR